MNVDEFPTLVTVDFRPHVIGEQSDEASYAGVLGDDTSVSKTKVSWRSKRYINSQFEYPYYFSNCVHALVLMMTRASALLPAPISVAWSCPQLF
jgi:hypothetical protein